MDIEPRAWMTRWLAVLSESDAKELILRNGSFPHMAFRSPERDYFLEALHPPLARMFCVNRIGKSEQNASFW
jgi:hypothetical protein